MDPAWVGRTRKMRQHRHFCTRFRGTILLAKFAVFVPIFHQEWAVQILECCPRLFLASELIISTFARMGYHFWAMMRAE